MNQNAWALTDEEFDEVQQWNANYVKKVERFDAEEGRVIDAILSYNEAQLSVMNSATRGHRLFDVHAKHFAEQLNDASDSFKESDAGLSVAEWVAEWQRAAAVMKEIADALGKIERPKEPRMVSAFFQNNVKQSVEA